MHKVILYAIFLLPALLVADSQYVEETAVKNVIENYYNAWNKHDSKKMAEFYASDADLRTPWNEFAKNRKEIEEIFVSQHANMMKNAHIDFSIKSIRLVKPDIAFVDAESTISGMKSSGERQYAPLHHSVVFLLVKRDGKWQILNGRPF